MVRIVADPSGRIVPDLKGRLPSRGAYVCPDADCIRRAAAGRLGASLKLPGGGAGADHRTVQQAVAEEYRRRVLALLGQARKSGKFTSGTNMVEGEIRRGAGDRWLALVAEDSSGAISEKIRRSLRSASVPCRLFLTRNDLGQALGKSPRSVALIKDQGIARAMEDSMDRYFRVLGKGGLDR